MGLRITKIEKVCLLGNKGVEIEGPQTTDACGFRFEARNPGYETSLGSLMDILLLIHGFALQPVCYGKQRSESKVAANDR